MKLAIKVLTEWDRENVIPFFEKYYPNCNNQEPNIDFTIEEIEIGRIYFIDRDGILDSIPYNIRKKFIPDYTILQGVPKDMELPKTREQELEECFSELFLFVDDKNGTLEVVNGFRVSDILTKAKQLLNK